MYIHIYIRIYIVKTYLCWRRARPGTVPLATRCRQVARPSQMCVRVELYVSIYIHMYIYVCMYNNKHIYTYEYKPML